MRRIIDHYLVEWKKRQQRKPLILRGARQVGKTYAARKLGKSFENFIEVNLERDKDAREILSKDLDVGRMLRQFSALYQKEIIPSSTLLFIDEIQMVPNALIALRYFYEEVPDLHIIAAGSLLDFAIQQVGLPVGRVTQLYMYPLSFMEFVVALGNKEWAQLIIEDQPVFTQVHEKLLELVGHYLAIGGMPAAVNAWKEQQFSREVKKVHSDILNAYVGDFASYARRHQVKYVSLVFQNAMKQLSKRFVFSQLGEYRKRELDPALELLAYAGIIYKVFRATANGIPIGADADLNDFKTLFLDVGLTQSILQYDLNIWLLKPLEMFSNKGYLVEAFIGQELLAYSDPIAKETLFYWRKCDKKSQAEIDYLVQLGEQIIPIEVKSGKSTRLKSMHFFLDTHPGSNYGLRFWASEQEHSDTIYSFPLYAVAKTLYGKRAYLKEALSFLLS